MSPSGGRVFSLGAGASYGDEQAPVKEHCEFLDDLHLTRLDLHSEHKSSLFSFNLVISEERKSTWSSLFSVVFSY